MQELLCCPQAEGGASRTQTGSGAWSPVLYGLAAGEAPLPRRLHRQQEGPGRLALRPLSPAGPFEGGRPVAGGSSRCSAPGPCPPESRGVAAAHGAGHWGSWRARSRPVAQSRSAALLEERGGLEQCLPRALAGGDHAWEGSARPRGIQRHQLGCWWLRRVFVVYVMKQLCCLCSRPRGYNWQTVPIKAHS